MSDDARNEDRLIEYLLDELEPDDRAQVEAAIGRDPRQEKALVGLRGAVEAIRDAGSATPPVGFEERLSAKLACEVQPPVRLVPDVPTELADGISRESRPIGQPPSRRHVRRFVAMLKQRNVRWSMAAAAAVAVLILGFWPHPGKGKSGGLAQTQTPNSTKPLEANQAQPLLAVISVRQPATDDRGHAIKPGDRLAAGCRIATGEKGRITLITRRGSELTLNSSSKLALAANGKDTTLSEGQLYCRNREHEFGAIHTAAGKIELLGTTVDAAVKDNQTVAVTVVEGKVRLENAQGQTVVDSGKKSLLIAQAPPASGEVVNTAAETAWYDGRQIVSDYGEIAYAVRRGDKDIAEIWVMNANGSGKHRVKSYVGFTSSPGPWLPGQQVVLLKPWGLIWAYPDFDTQRADAHRGAPLLEPWGTWWLLDTATEQDVPIAIPSEYSADYMRPSPDATMIAFGGTRRDPGTNSRETGIWLYELHTGAITKLLGERPEKEPAWSPDGKRLAFATGSPSSINHSLRLVVVDIETRAVNDLNVAGADPCFSPDGTKLAYVAGITGRRTERDQGKIFVLNLEPGAQPRQISPGAEAEGSAWPQWSPDGMRVLYTVWDIENHRRILKVAAADGSGTVELYQGAFWPAIWNRTGDAVYVNEKKGVLLVAADGSGVIKNLGGNEGDSPLSPAENAELQSVETTMQQAVFQHAMGKRYAYYGQTSEGQAAHQKSAQVFAEMPWRCPGLGLSLTHAMVYADAEQAMADRVAAQIFIDTCKQRLSHAAYLVAAYASVNGKFAPDLPTVETWAKAFPTTMNDVIRLDRDDISVVFRCPDGQPFTYTAPGSGMQPTEGDVMLTCPSHPDIKATWRKSGKKWDAETPSGYRITEEPK